MSEKEDPSPPPTGHISGKHSFVKGCFAGISKSWKNKGQVDPPPPELIIHKQPLDTVLGIR